MRDRNALKVEKTTFIVLHIVAIEGVHTTNIVGHTTMERAHKLRVVLTTGWLEFLVVFTELRLFYKGYDIIVDSWHDLLGCFGVVVDCIEPYIHGTISKTKLCFSFLGGFLAGREISIVFKGCFKGCCNSDIIS